MADAIVRHGIALSPGDAADVEAFLDALTDTAVTTDTRYARPGKTCEIS